MVQLYIKLTDYNEAKIYADLLIEKKPYFVEGYYDAAYVYMKLGDIERAKELLEDARCCRITFMSVVKETDLDAFEAALDGNYDYEHKLGKFSGEEEYTEEDFKNLPEIEEEAHEEDIDEDDPFI
jgi:tetratricopeptide (TPR) repeat protein